jgi:hypothetical protein
MCGLVFHTAALKSMAYCRDKHYYKCTCGWKDKQKIVWQIHESHAVIFISFLFLLLAYWPKVTDIRIYTCCWCHLPHYWRSRRISKSCKLFWYGALKSMLLLQVSCRVAGCLHMELCCPKPPLLPHIYLRKPITENPTTCTVRSDSLTHCHARQAYIMQ